MRWLDSINEFRVSPYKIMLIQEHHLDAMGCLMAAKHCKANRIAAIFSPRADGSAREGVAILVKFEEFGIDRQSVSFKAAVDGKVRLVLLSSL